MNHLQPRIIHVSELDFTANYHSGECDEEAREQIYERYENTSVDVDELVACAEGLNRFIINYRYAYHSATLGFFNMSPEERTDIDALAMDPTRVPDLIKLFGERCREYYAREPATYELTTDALGIEVVGGVFQFGLLKATEALDQAIMTIPEELPATGLQVAITDKPAQRAINYRAQLLPGDDYALVRRRRAAGNVSNGLRIVKESLGMVVLSQVDPRDRDLMLADFQVHPDKNSFDKGTNNTVAANTAGRVFKRAIELKPEGVLALFPLEAHYYMVMKRGAVS